MSKETYKVYSRVLNFGLHMGPRRLFETIVFGFSIFAITLVYLYFLIRTDLSAIGKYIFFPFGLLGEIILILSYIENHYQLNIFGEIATKFFTIIISIGLLNIILYAALPWLYTTQNIKGTNVALIVLFFVLTIVETGYFLYSVPRAELGEGSFGLEHQFKRLETRLSTKKLVEIPVDRFINRGINALKERIRFPELLWGDLDPMYETALVLDLFHYLGYTLDTEWVVEGEKGPTKVSIRNIVENLSVIVKNAEIIDINYRQFYILYALSLYDPTILDNRHDDINNFYEEIQEITEWDFINQLNKFTTNLRASTTPIHISMCYVADQIGHIPLLDKLASLFTTSIEVIIKRGYARFSASQTGKTPIEMFARLVLALHDIRRPTPRRQQFIKAVSSTQYLEGSWAGNIGTTGYVVQALLPNETAESILLKKAAVYLCAVQDNSGLWAGNIEETVIALKALIGIKKLAEMELV